MIIILHVIQWFPKWQNQCCRAPREHCLNYLLKFLTKLIGLNHRFV